MWALTRDDQVCGLIDITSAETLHLKQQLLVLNDYLCRHMNIHYCNAAYDRKLEGGKKSTDVR